MPIRPGCYIRGTGPSADVAEEPDDEQAKQPGQAEQEHGACADEPADRPEGSQQHEKGRQGDRPQDEQDRERAMEEAVASLNVDDRSLRLKHAGFP